MKSQNSNLFALRIIWCGRKISKDGVPFDSAYLEGLTENPPPERGKQLQDLLTGLNWIRSNIPDYARNLATLQQLLKRCQGQINSANASKLSRISSVHAVTWKADHDTAFSRVNEVLADAVTLPHPKQDYELCLFIHASDPHWGIILTQVSKKQLKVSVHDHEHEPLPFFSGSFNRSQRHRSIIDKEAFPIMELLHKLRHCLLSDNLFRSLNKNRNFMFVFDPISKTQTSRTKLWITWANGLQSFKDFTI